MRCFKISLLISAFLLSSVALAQTPIEGFLTPEEAVKQVKEQGLLEGLNLTGEYKATNKDIETFLRNASNQTNNITKDALSIGDTVSRPNAQTFMFISLSMPRASVKDALKNAAEFGVTVYINGMFDGDKTIMDTMARLAAISNDLVIKPNVKFGPTWFKKYEINRVPALVHDNETIQLKMGGMTQMAFFYEKLEQTSTTTDFGDYGATFPVEEKSLIDQIQERLDTVDWGKKQTAAVDNFWKKRKANILPAATKNETFFIDPTVTVQRDIINRKGVLLAKAGTTFNPITAMPNAYLGLYIVDATDPNQLAWLDREMPNFDYRDQVILTQLDVGRGWKHLAELRKRYGREVYLLENELINKFSLKAVPSRVSVENGYIEVREYYLRDKI